MSDKVQVKHMDVQVDALFEVQNIEHVIGSPMVEAIERARDQGQRLGQANAAYWLGKGAALDGVLSRDEVLTHVMAGYEQGQRRQVASQAAHRARSVEELILQALADGPLPGAEVLSRVAEYAAEDGREGPPTKGNVSSTMARLAEKGLLMNKDGVWTLFRMVCRS